MKRKFSYSILEMNCRLLAIGRPIRKYIVISTLASIFGALAHMGLMGFGALWLLAAAGYCRGTVIYAALTMLCAALISLCRYLEGVFSIRVLTAFWSKCGCISSTPSTGSLPPISSAGKPAT